VYNHFPFLNTQALYHGPLVWRRTSACRYGRDLIVRLCVRFRSL